MKYDLEFTDVNGQGATTPRPPTASSDVPAEHSQGCLVTRCQGFVLLLTALAVAGGVGVGVHYLTPDRITCELSNEKGHGGGQHQHTPSMHPALYPTRRPPIRDVRLPTNLIPIHYDLELRPDFYGPNPELFRFTGSVIIQINCTAPTQQIVLHSAGLIIDGISIELNDTLMTSSSVGKTPQVTGQTEDRERQFLKISLDRMLMTGSVYRLNMTFSGNLSDSMSGLYRSSYAENNLVKWMVTSHMEPTDARTAFPCFDEPHLKATFSVTLKHKLTHTALSNMPVEETIYRDNDWVDDRFEKSVKMSTYLLAFVVCEFSYVRGRTKSGTEFRVYTRREAISQARYALAIGMSMHDFFETYFNVPYPLPKQDLIAVPDFAAGAMENWGLITFRETALLYDPQVSSTVNKERVASVISHELGHQWFGNLVSPAWWDDLWLNEGFASYVEFLGVHHAEPTWQMMDLFLTSDLHTVLALDSLSVSHPIYVPVFNPDEISEIFDTITYSKGASVIRMMSDFLGEDTFRAGLTRYLTQYQFANANHTNLWTALTEQGRLNGNNLDVGSVMNTWIKQMGYPLVTVTYCPHAAHNESPGVHVTVSQTHFLTDSQRTTPLEQSPYKYNWKIPFTYTFRSIAVWSNPTIHWMMSTSGNDTFNEEMSVHNDSGEWIIGNIGQFGYYRVNYDLVNWNRLLYQLKSNHTAIPVKNRAQIIDDSFQIGRAGIIDQLIGLKATQYLINETEYIPWAAAARHLRFIRTMLDRSDVYGKYQDYVRQLIMPLYNSLRESTTDSHTQKLLRSLVIDLACRSGHEACLRNALSLFNQWMSTRNTNLIHSDVRSSVYCYAIRQGGVREWDFAFNQYLTANVAAEKDRLLYAMSCSREPWILSRYINVTWTRISKQDVLHTLSRISSNPVGRLLVWNFFRSQWTAIKDRFGSSLFALNRLLTNTIDAFNTKFELEEVIGFRDRFPDLGSVTRAYEQAVERTQLNIDWMDRNHEKIAAWLLSI